VRGDYAARIARAHRLAAKFPASAALLDFYAKIATLQSRIYSALPATPPSAHFPALLALVNSHAPEPLILYARDHLQSSAQLESLLTDAPQSPEARFFARVLLQPQAEHQTAQSQTATTSYPNCPLCDSKPVAAILRGEGDGAKRSLLCSLCAIEWPFRRVLCPNCGEEQKDQLPIYTSAAIEYVRVEACDICRTYIKSVDLTKDGFAVPEVDELATVALDVWADEHGYAKLEPNILGM
jgi:FdhE protein